MNCCTSLRGDCVIQCVGGRHRADQDQHDQAHALLPVVGTVEEADAGAGEHEKRANGPRRRCAALRRLVESGILDECFRQQEQQRAAPKPMMGEMSSTLKTLVACSQSTPEVPVCTLISWLATPTPMMEPTMVCELDAGRPNHHVPRFHKIAAIRRQKPWRIRRPNSPEESVRRAAA